LSTSLCPGNVAEAVPPPAPARCRWLGQRERRGHTSRHRGRGLTPGACRGWGRGPRPAPSAPAPPARCW